MEKKLTVQKIENEAGLAESIKIIRDAFMTVAEELKLTQANSPTNPAFIEMPALLALKEKEVVFYGLFQGEQQIGFIALEKANGEVYYLEKLAVIPEYRHHGCGRYLMDFAFDWVQSEGGKKISIALIEENTRLKQWYQDYGFNETGKKQFPHLPFTVCFMEKEV